MAKTSTLIKKTLINQSWQAVATSIYIIYIPAMYNIRLVLVCVRAACLENFYLKIDLLIVIEHTDTHAHTH